MGKRGPAPKPKALRVLHGERGKRLESHEPIPPSMAIEAPAQLAGVALEIWNGLAPQLEQRGLLTSWDVEAFAAFCSAAAQARAAEADIAERGILVAGRADTLVRNPSITTARIAAGTIVSLAGRFGLTPSDRTALGILIARGGESDGDGKPKRQGPERLLS